MIGGGKGLQHWIFVLSLLAFVIHALEGNNYDVVDNAVGLRTWKYDKASSSFDEEDFDENDVVEDGNFVNVEKFLHPKNIFDASTIDSCTHWEFKMPQGTIIQKKSYSDKFRVVFIQGIEGTGHHMFQTLVKYVNKNHNGAFAMTRSMFRGPFSRMYAPKKADNIPASTYLDALTSWGSTMQNMRELQSDNKLTFFPHTLWSYPAFWGHCKGIRYPDIRNIAAEMEKRGIDFRVVTLLRDPIKTIQSNVRRGFYKQFNGAQKTMNEYVRILQDMHDQMTSLDENFVHCFEFDNPEIPDSLGKFLNFDGNLGEQFAAIKLASKEAHHSSGAEKQISQKSSDYDYFWKAPGVAEAYEKYEELWRDLLQRCRSINQRKD